MSPSGRAACLSLAILAGSWLRASAEQAPGSFAGGASAGGKEGPSPCIVLARVRLEHKLSCPLELLPMDIEIEARCPAVSPGGQRLPDQLSLSLPLGGQVQLFDVQLARLRPASPNQSPIWTYTVASDGDTELHTIFHGFVRPAMAGEMLVGEGGEIRLSDNAGGQVATSVEPAYLSVSSSCASTSRRTIFLPTARNEGCGPARQPADMVVVLDQSMSAGSIGKPLASGVARGLIDALDLERDRVGIVAFDQRARLVVPLTGDRRAIDLGLASLQLAAGSRIDTALLAAVSELTGPRALAGRRRLIGLISDGVDTGPGGRAAVLAAAQSASDEHIGIITLAIGKAPDHGLLNAISSDPKLTLSAVTPDDLDRAYRAMTEVAQCVR